MARSLAYSPWRRLLLQAVLCLVLIAALGLASVVTQYKLHAWDVKLGPAVRDRGMSVRLPVGWVIDKPMRLGAQGDLLWKATEPENGGVPGRVLTIVRDHQDLPQPPEEYLLTSGIMSAEYAPSLGGGGRLLSTSAAMIAGQIGYMATGERPVRVRTGQMVLEREIFASAMLPSRDVISVKLEGWAPTMPRDLQLVLQVGEGIELPAGKTVAGEVVTLPDGCKVGKPGGYEQLPESDVHLTERHLVRSISPENWSSITLVPCVFFRDADDQETFRTMLTARDAEWLQSRITTVNGVLQADLPQRAGLPFPRRACLLTWPSGYALMVEMLAGSTKNAAEWDEALKKVAKTATPPGAGKTPMELLKAGDREIERLRKVGLASLLSGDARDQWWVWKLDGQPVGWNRLAFVPGADACRGSSESRMMRGTGNIAASVRYDFETSSDFQRHHDAAIGRDLIAGARAVDRFKEQTSLADGKLSMAILPDTSGQVARLTRAAPTAFLPGPWLPLLMGKLTRQEMILRTSRLPGLESHMATAALTVRLRPSTRPATFEVDLSGTGQTLTISADEADFSASLIRQRASAEEVKKLFGNQREMAPQ